jgi:hypothetical protein
VTGSTALEAADSLRQLLAAVLSRKTVKPFYSVGIRGTASTVKKEIPCSATTLLDSKK